MRTRHYFLIAALLGAPACEGKVDNFGAERPDAAAASPDAGPVADAGPLVTGLAVTGATVDYASLGATPQDPVPGVTLATSGMEPPLQTTSDLLGAYTLADVPPGNAFLLRATSAGDLFVPTANTAITVLDQSVTTDVYVMTKVFHDRQYTTAAVVPIVNASLVIASLENLDGSPWVDLPVAAISLVAAGTDTPVPGVTTFFMGDTDVDIALTASRAAPRYGARVIFLNVPPGTYEVRVNHLPAGGGAAQTAVASAIAYDGGGAVLQNVVYDPGAAGGGALKFATDIYPILQKASAGGQDCASCHSAGNVGAVLIMNDGVQATYDRLKGTTGVIDLATPASSLLLSMPLYETPANHVNATWLDATNPFYVKILAWITAGAPL